MGMEKADDTSAAKANIQQVTDIMLISISEKREENEIQQIPSHTRRPLSQGLYPQGMK